MKFHDSGFSGESRTAVAAVGHYAALGWRRDCPEAAFTASTVVAAVAVLPVDRLAVN